MDQLVEELVELAQLLDAELLDAEPPVVELDEERYATIISVVVSPHLPLGCT